MNGYVLISFLCTLSLESTSGAVVSMDWKTAGDGLLTRDLDNKMDWLDFSETMTQDGVLFWNRTFDDISSQLGPGGEFEGFRHATESEIIALWTSAGISSINTGTSDEIHPPILALVGLMGLTHTTGVIPHSAGLYAGSEAPNSHLFASLEIIPDTFNQTFARARIPLGSIDDDRTNLAGGHFLVRSSQVPEPSSLALGLGALACLLGLGRQRR